jgi:hypothetical protein
VLCWVVFLLPRLQQDELEIVLDFQHLIDAGLAARLALDFLGFTVSAAMCDAKGSQNKPYFKTPGPRGFLLNQGCCLLHVCLFVCRLLCCVCCSLLFLSIPPILHLFLCELCLCGVVHGCVFLCMQIVLVLQPARCMHRAMTTKRHSSEWLQSGSCVPIGKWRRRLVQ